jgi:hypothetical protein
MTDDENTPNHDLPLDTDSTADAEFQGSVTLGKPTIPDGQNGPGGASTNLSIAGVPDALSPSVDWYYQERPVLYVYDVHSEEPAFLIALPTADDPKARLVMQRERTVDEWFDEHRPGE